MDELHEMTCISWVLAFEFMDQVVKSSALGLAFDIACERGIAKGNKHYLSVHL